MKILFVAAEASPLVKIGGLADVAGSLPKALIELGHDARIIMPRYWAIDGKKFPQTRVMNGIKSQFMMQDEWTALNQTTIQDELVVYLMEHDRIFGGPDVYGNGDLERFLFFSRAVAEALPLMDWQPDIVHCHDWHTGLVPMWLKRAGKSYGTMFTIHNLAYQGGFDEPFALKSGLGQCWFDSSPKALKPPFSYMGQGIVSSDLVTTVSETYAKEILTPEQGGGLDSLLLKRKADLLGIINGIDYSEYDPEKDPNIPKNYTSATFRLKAPNKLALQKRASLPENAAIPLIGMVQRFDEQKGFDILITAVEHVFHDTGVQLVILGRGREHYQNLMTQLAAHHSGRMAVFLDFNEPLARLIYAGSDMFLMPSRFEPCGLGQLIAMRYGSIPVVRHTGGLVDTVPDFSPDLKEGNGFVFSDYSPEALIEAFQRGISAYKNKDAWNRAVQRVMQKDFSWRSSALKYEAAYRRILEVRNTNG
jgi:starch synthase